MGTQWGYCPLNDSLMFSSHLAKRPVFAVTGWINMSFSTLLSIAITSVYYQLMNRVMLDWE